jgi:hypothetical protein
MNCRSIISRLVLAMVVLMTPSAWAQDGLRGAISRFGTSASRLHDPFGQRFVAADLDQDQKPDGAVLLGGNQRDAQRAFRIELHVTAGKDEELTFDSTDAFLSLSVQDVNYDGTPDIVVEQTFTHKRVQIWLNDGHGSFRVAKSEDYPSATESPIGWREVFPRQDSITLFLPTRPRSEHSASISESIAAPAISECWRFWSQFLVVLSSPRAPASSRAPPSFQSL